MAKISVKHECGHTSRVEVGDGTAQSKSAQAFEASLQNCPACRVNEEANEDFAVSQNAIQEQREQDAAARDEITSRRQSKEARKNAKAQAVWQSLRYEGERAGTDGQQETFSCASQSTPGTRYTITHDLTNGNLHCDCTAGAYGRDCIHQAAVRRYLASRAVHIAGQAEMEARMTAELRERDTAMLRRSNQPFSLYR